MFIKSTTPRLQITNGLELQKKPAAPPQDDGQPHEKSLRGAYDYQFKIFMVHRLFKFCKRIS